MSIRFLSSRIFILSITTAVPWGISFSVNLRIFSLIISAASTFSGWSVSVSSGKKWPPSEVNFFNSSFSSSSFEPVSADTGTIASKSISFEYLMICSRITSLSFIVSVLLIANTQGKSSFLTFSINILSFSLISWPASVTSKQASTPATDSLIERTI